MFWQNVSREIFGFRMNIAHTHHRAQRIAATALLLATALAVPLTAKSTGSPHGTKPNSRAKLGDALFHEQCIGCHNKQPDDTSSFGPPNLYRVFVNKPAITPQEARGIIAKGKGQMPPFAGKLSSSQIDDVLAYLKSQQVAPEGQ